MYLIGKYNYIYIFYTVIYLHRKLYTSKTLTDHDTILKKTYPKVIIKTISTFFLL